MEKKASTPSPPMSTPEGPPKLPTWVKAFGIAAIVLAVLVVVVLVAGGGQHGPGRHLGSDDETPTPSPTASDAPPTSSEPTMIPDLSRLDLARTIR